MVLGWPPRQRMLSTRLELTQSSTRIVLEPNLRTRPWEMNCQLPRSKLVLKWVSP